MNIQHSPIGPTDVTVDFVSDTSKVFTDIEINTAKIFFDIFFEVAFKNPTPQWLASCRNLLQTALKDFEAHKLPAAKMKSYQMMFDCLTQETKPFTMKAAPEALPLPLSTSFPQKTALIAHCKNRALHWMLTERETERSAFIKTYTRKFRSPKEASTLNEQNKITFRKENSVYELLLNHKQFVYLFFPGILAATTFDMSQEQLASIVADLFSEYPFFAKDRRFEQHLEGKTFVVESMLTSNSLDILPEELTQGREFRKKLMRYLAFLMHYGITTSPNLLSNTHLHSLVQTAVKLLEKTPSPHAEDPDTKQFYSYFYDAISVIQKKVPTLWEELRLIPSFTTLQPLAKPDTAQSADYLLPYHPEQSFLLRDLRTHYDLKCTSVPLKAEKRSQHVLKVDELQEMLLTKIAEQPKGLHIIFVPAKETLHEIGALREKIMEQLIAPQILLAWKSHVAKAAPKVSVDNFLNLWNQPSEKFTSELLQIIPLLDTKLLSEIYFDKKLASFDMQRYRPNTTADNYISRLITQCYSPEEIKHLKESIGSSARKILSWHKERARQVPIDPQTPIISVISNLTLIQELCQTEVPLRKIRNCLSECLFPKGQHVNKHSHRELFFLQFLLAGELCQIAPFAAKTADIRFNDTQEAHNRFFAFSPSQISISDSVSSLSFNLLLDKRDLPTHHIHITSALDAASLEILRRVKKEILSISMISKNPAAVSHDSALFEKFLQTLEY